MTDKEILDFIEQHVDCIDISGYGADDKWVTLLHHGGNRAEDSTVRGAVTNAKKGW